MGDIERCGREDIFLFQQGFIDEKEESRLNRTVLS